MTEYEFTKKRLRQVLEIPYVSAVKKIRPEMIVSSRRIFLLFFMGSNIRLVFNNIIMMENVELISRLCFIICCLNMLWYKLRCVLDFYLQLHKFMIIFIYEIKTFSFGEKKDSRRNWFCYWFLCRSNIKYELYFEFVFAIRLEDFVVKIDYNQWYFIEVFQKR